MMADLSNSGAIPALESMVRFAAQRQKMLANNIANLNTPGYLQQDVSIGGFQHNLREAIEKRQEERGGQGPLELKETEELTPLPGGGFRLNAGTPIEAGGVLFHDRNNRNLEQLMQGLAENTGVLRVATDLLKSQNDMLRSAIAQRV